MEIKYTHLDYSKIKRKGLYIDYVNTKHLTC